jgi:hypothetical protein
LFVRGDRNIDLTNNLASGATTLRATGELFSGAMTLDTNANTESYSGKGNAQELSDQIEYYNLIANPYQAILDFNAVTKSGITDFIYIRDATLATNGAWVTIESSTGNQTQGPVSAANRYIPPGKAFFVQNSGTSPSITFEEADKATAQNEVDVLSDVTLFYVNAALYSSSGLQNGNRPLDGFGLKFDSQYTTPGSLEDGNKLINDFENIAVVNNGLKYIDNQNLPSIGHVVQLHISGYTDSNYSLVFKMEHAPSGTGVFVNDAYLGTQTEISNDFVFDFTIDANIPQSMAEDRFSLVFDNTTLSVTDQSFGDGFSLYPNPSTNGDFSIKTPNLSGEVEVEMTNTLGQVINTQHLKIISNEVNVQTSALASGIYFVKLTHDKQTFATIVIIE